MRAWKIAGGLAQGQFPASEVPPDNTVFQGFETDSAGFVGAGAYPWTRTGEWAASGSYSFVSTNKGVDNSRSITDYAVDIKVDSTLGFDFYVSGEAGYDGLLVTVNGTNWVRSDYVLTEGDNPPRITQEGALTGARMIGSATMFLPVGQYTIRFTFVKDQSASSFNDVAYIDNFKIIEGSIATRFVGAGNYATSYPGQSPAIARVPADAQVGDLLVASMMRRASEVMPSGWTLEKSQTGSDSGTNQDTVLWSKVCTSQDLGSSVSIPGDAGRVALQIVAYRKSIGTPQILARDSKYNPSIVTTDTTPTMTGTANGQMVHVTTSWILSNGNPTFTIAPEGRWTIDSSQSSGDTANPIRTVALHGNVNLNQEAYATITAAASASAQIMVTALIG